MRTLSFPFINRGVIFPNRAKLPLELQATAVFQNKETLEAAVAALQKQGFPGSEIVIQVCRQGNLLDVVEKKSSKTAEGIVLGVIVGFILGSLVGAINNSLVSLLTYVGIFCLLGSVIGAIFGLGVPEYNIAAYNSNLKEGSMLVQIKTQSPANMYLAQAIMASHGGALTS